jgi:hypothetical protein
MEPTVRSGYSAKEADVNDPVIRQRTDGMLFVWLLLAGLLGSLIGVPRTVAVLMDPAAGGPVDPRLVWLSAVVEALLFLAPASAVGVWLGKKVGLGPRLLRELVSRIPGGWKHLRSSLLPTTLVGSTLGVLGFFAQYSLPEGVLGPGLDNPSTFEYFLSSLSAGLTEEIFFRLGLLTFFVWAIRLVVKKPALNTPSLWAGNILVALIFAAAHLPHILTFGSISSDLLFPIVMVSCSASLVMGWLYMRYSLISAIVAHFIVDLVVYVIPRLLIVIA